MTFNPADITYFHRGDAENARFWTRFGGRPRLENAEVLDLGCGHGSLCVEMAQAGASRVVGLDLNSRLIEFAQAFVPQTYPDLAPRLTFLCQDLHDYPAEHFDLILSKDTFEHVLDLPGVLAAIRERLRPGGRLYAGFGPLYNSPLGDHGAARLPIPWAHLLLGDRRLIERVNRRRRVKVQSIADLGMNRLTFASYRRNLYDAGMRVIYFQTNRSDKVSSRIFSLLARVPFLTEYFTHNIYCILEKTD